MIAVAGNARPRSATRNFDLVQVLSAAFTIFGASHFGIPLSTTHTITTAIVGAGASRRVYDVRWGVLRRIILAWGATFPFCALIAFLAALAANRLAG